MLGLKLNHVSKRGHWYYDNEWLYCREKNYDKYTCDQSSIYLYHEMSLFSADYIKAWN